MKKYFVATIAFVLCIGFAVAQKKRKPLEPLETGNERKLGVVYKEVGKRKLALDVYYPEGNCKAPLPGNCLHPWRRLGGRESLRGF